MTLRGRPTLPPLLYPPLPRCCGQADTAIGTLLGVDPLLLSPAKVARPPSGLPSSAFSLCVYTGAVLAGVSEGGAHGATVGLSVCALEDGGWGGEGAPPPPPFTPLPCLPPIPLSQGTRRGGGRRQAR